MLYAHRKPIMDALFGNTKELLGFSETIAFLDLTNVFHYGRKHGDLLRHGCSKEKRSDCPLVTLALTIDTSGFPRSAEILPGNASEPATLEKAIHCVFRSKWATVPSEVGHPASQCYGVLMCAHQNWKRFNFHRIQVWFVIGPMNGKLRAKIAPRFFIRPMIWIPQLDLSEPRNPKFVQHGSWQRIQRLSV